MTVLSGTDFCSAVETAYARKPLVNSDGYSLKQYQFKDVDDASFFYGPIANSIFVIVDSNRDWTKVAPIVADENGSFANVAETIEVSFDELYCSRQSTKVA